MPNFQRKGVYSGGVVTAGAGADTHIYISPYLLNLYDGDVTGIGNSQVPGVGKEILVNFGGIPGGATLREDTLDPSYTISTGSNAGNVWIYYNESKQDISFSNTPLTGVVTFAKIVWTSVLNMAGVSVDTEYVAPPTGPNRTEANVAEIDNPADAKNFYYDGQPWIGGKLNKPLANMAVVMEALQEQSLSLLGGTFFITLATLSDIVGSGSTLALKPVRHISRASTNYKIYHTKENSAVHGAGNAFRRTFSTPEDVNGDNLYITIKRDTGEPGIYRVVGDSTLYDKDTTDWLIAKTTGPWGAGNVLALVPGVDDLSQLTWEISHNLIGLNAIKDRISLLVRGVWPSGFFNPVEVTTAGTTNTVAVPELIGSVKGNHFYLSGAAVTLGAPPADTGGQQDFIFVQITVQTSPDVVITPQIRVFANFDYATYKDPFSNPGILAQLEDDVVTPTPIPTGEPFVLQSDGSYKSVNSGDTSEYYALPLAIVSRFNTGAYADANLNGGGSRPDGKTATIINNDEILTVAPIINRKDKKQLFDEAFKLVLAGRLNSQLTLAVSSADSYSKKPLQIDYLLSHSVGTQVGDTDGGRRFWSGNTSKAIPMGLTFRHDSTTTWPYLTFTYNPGNNDSRLTLRVPSSISGEAEIYTDVNGQAKDVVVQWVSDGSLVALVGLWTLSYTTTLDNSLVTAAWINLDTAHPSYAAHHSANAKIAVTFKMRYPEAKPLTRVPVDFYKVQRNNNNGKTDYFAVVPSTANNPTLHTLLNASGSRVLAPINSVDYHDRLFINRSGASTKGYAHMIYYVVPGNGQASVDYTLPTTYEINASDYPVFGDDTVNYNVLGVIDALDKNGNSIGITKLEWKVAGTPSFRVQLAQVIPTTEPIYFVLGLEGAQFDYSAGSLEISNLTRAVAVTTIVAPNAEYFYYSYLDPVTNTGGHPIFGFSSLQNKLIIYAESGDADTELLAVPVKLAGTQGALIRVSTVITQAEYNVLDNIHKACYMANSGPSGGWRIVTGYALRFSILYGMMETEALVMSYNFGALPFTAFDPATPATIVYSGILLLSTDGSANEGSSVYSPISERFPVVQGVSIIGTDTVAGPLGLNPVELYNQGGEWLAEGGLIKLDGSYSLGVFVTAGTGLAVWGCLVQVGVRLLLFIYEVRSGAVLLTNPEQAFVAELKYNMRELE